jgi:hypothetical protein
MYRTKHDRRLQAHEVEIRNRKKQGKHKTNGEINEQIAILKLNEHEKLLFSISL